jgi:AcrR family transcriptional regulator
MPRAKRRRAKPKPLVRGEAVVREILVATLAEVARAGYHGLRIEDVATRAGVNKTTVYRRWPSKQELVRDALLSITLGSDHAAPNTGSLRTDLLAIARRHVEVTAKPGVQALFRIFVAEGGDPELASIVRSLREAFAGVPREVIAAAVARGELAPDVNPSLVFEILGAAQHWWLLFERMPFDESLVEQVIDLLLHGALQPRQFPTSRNQ